MGLQHIKVIFLATFGLNQWSLIAPGYAGVIPHVSGKLGAGSPNQQNPLIHHNLRYSNSESGELKMSKSIRTDLPDANENYPQFNPQGTDEQTDDRSGGQTGGTDRDPFFTTEYPTYTRLGKPITWGPRVPTTKRQPPPPPPPRPKTTANQQPRVGVTIIGGRLPAQLLGSQKQTIDSSIMGVSDSDVGLVAGIFMGVFLIVGILIAVNIQCVQSRFYRSQFK